MKKYILLMIVALLSCATTLLAQNVWDNSACLYQSDNINKSEIILRTTISTGTIIFYTSNEQLFLNKFNNAGDPTIAEPLSLGIGGNGEMVFRITATSDSKYLVGWRDGDNLKAQRFDVNGNAEWATAITIPITDYASHSITESVLLNSETELNVILSYAANSSESIVHYQVNLIDNNAQILEPVVIYEGNQTRFLNGIFTSAGINLMWVIPNQNKFVIYKNSETHELLVDYIPDLPNDTPRFAWETGRIIELNETTTVYALKERGCFNPGFAYSGIFIFNETDSTLQKLPTYQSIMDVCKLSDNEFLVISMENYGMNFNKYDEAGNIIFATDAPHPFWGVWYDGHYNADTITSLETQVTGNDVKFAIASVYIYFNGDQFSFSTHLASKLAIYNYNKLSMNCSVVDYSISPNNLMLESSEFVLIEADGVSFLNEMRFDLYSAHQRCFVSSQPNSELQINPYEIGQSNRHRITQVKSFPWQGDNLALMRANSTILEAGVNENGELGNIELLPNWAKFDQLHEFSPDNYAFHYTYYSNMLTHNKLRLYKADGTIETIALQGNQSEQSRNASFSDITNGNGWFVYLSDNFFFHKVVAGNLEEESYTPFVAPHLLSLLAIKDNYLILRSDYDFRITKIDDEGNIASGWEELGELFAAATESSAYRRDSKIHSYQNKLIFSHLTNNNYSLFLINPDNLDETTTLSLPSQSGLQQKEFQIGNKFYCFNNYNNNLTLTCYDLANNLAELWVVNLAENAGGRFDVKKLDNRFVVAYSQGEEEAERVYLRTVSFIGNSDQYEAGYALALNNENQYSPTLSVVDNNTVYVNRIESNSDYTPGVYTDLIDLSYFVPNSSQEVAPVTIQASNYPNPFNPETTITYAIPKTGQVNIEIYNLKGQKVKTLINQKIEAGTHRVVWNGKDQDGKSVSSGVYFFKVKTEEDAQVKKMLLMK